MIETSDKELIEQYFQGNEAAFDQLIKRYLSSVSRFVSYMTGNSHQADDLVQETFVKAWKQLKRFDAKRSFKPWLFTIARNTCIDHLRKKKATPMSSFEDSEGNNVLLDSLCDDEPTAGEMFDSDLKKGFLSDMIGKLSPAYQTVVSLRYENDLTFQEMSEVMGESIDTLKSRYRRALALLKKEAKDRPNLS